MTENRADPERSRRRLLRWLAPITSLGLLGFLIARVSSCESPPKPVSQAARTEPQLNVAALETNVARTPADAGTTGEAIPDISPTEALGLDTGYLGGSKSGFGGLGLRGEGRMPSTNLADVPAFGNGRSLEFLGATKASPPVISGSLGRIQKEEPAVEAPAQQGSEP